MGNKDSKSSQTTLTETAEVSLVTSERTGFTGVYIDKENIPSFKIVLIGDPGVGKTAIFERYIWNRFRDEYKPTKKVVLENVVKTVNLPSKAVNSVVLWDVPGSEDMDLRASYFRNVDAAIVVVDMNDIDSIELAGAWKQDFINKASNAKLVVDKLPNGIKVTSLEQLPCNPAKIPVMLLGNKYDLVEEKLEEERLRNDQEGNNKTANQTDEQTMERNFKNMKKRLDDGDKEEDEDSSEENKTDDDKPFPVQRAPRHTDPVPECVKLLDEVEEEHGFLGSVMVSAKDGDGSGDAAIQSLTRYLLEQHYGKRKPKERPPPVKKVEADKEDYKPLLELGNEEFDKLFKRCYNPMKRSGEYCSYYELVLKHFKQSCADNGFVTMVTTGKPSLEDCILGIREMLQVLGKMDLQIEECDHFINLTYNIDPRVKVPKEINISLNVFNTEYAIVCNSVLRDCPIVLGILDKLEMKIIEKSGKIAEIMAGKNEKVISRAVGVCEQNRARIAFAKTQVKNCIKEVENAKLKVKASLMW